MAHFRATIQGARGEASRLGHKSTGITVRAQTWGWDVATYVSHAESTGEDFAFIEMIHHSTGERRRVAQLNLTTGEVKAEG